jgi:hypothetical protein
MSEPSMFSLAFHFFIVLVMFSQFLFLCHMVGMIGLPSDTLVRLTMLKLPFAIWSDTSKHGFEAKDLSLYLPAVFLPLSDHCFFLQHCLNIPWHCLTPSSGTRRHHL